MSKIDSAIRTHTADVSTDEQYLCPHCLKADIRGVSVFGEVGFECQNCDTWMVKEQLVRESEL